MPKNSNAKEENSQSSKNIQIPPIRKQTAGAVTGAAAGSLAGPIGAVVGGVVGAVVGTAAEKGQPIVPTAKRTVRSVVKKSKAISKPTRSRGRSTKSSAKPRKARRGGSNAKQRKARAGSAGKKQSRRSAATRLRKGSTIQRRSKSSPRARKRFSGRKKRH